MQNILFIVNDSTYSGEKTFNAVRFAINMKEEHSKDVNIKLFCFSDAILCGIAGQNPNEGFNIQQLIDILAAQGAEIKLCTSCVKARGLLDAKLIEGGNKTLELIEAKILEMEHDLVEGEASEGLNKSIFNLKNSLLIQKNYYEQLIDIGEELQENENDIFQDENLRYFKIFTDKVTRLSNNTQALCDSLIHLREAYDATLEYSLNRIMKVFTVVTTIFLPLTLIVGWYGMNFTTMPELTWKYGYISVIILSIVVVVGCLIFFKKKKFL